MSSTDDLVAAFLAKGGSIKRVPEGERVLTEADLRRRLGPQPEKMPIFEVLLLGEDGQEFMWTAAARNRDDVTREARESWPEAQVLSVEPKGSREDRLYRQALNEEF